MENGKRMVLSQWSLFDTCMCACALCSVLVIDVNWTASWRPHQMARLARHWTSTSVCSSSMAPIFQCSAHSYSEPEQATWFLINTGFLDPVRQQHQQPRHLLHTRVEVPGTLKHSQLSILQWRHSSLIWSLARMDTVNRSIGTGLLHERHINWQDWQGMELAQCFILPARHQLLFNALLILARNWSRQRDSW